MNKKITLHVFCSVKGGVGKSTLATTCAKLLAANHRFPLLIDADLTGTSLADGLRLCAPKTALTADGTVDVEAAATGEFMNRDDVARYRRLRRDNPVKKGLPPAYLNDALRPYLESRVGYTGEVHVDALLWRHEVNDGVWYLPSSALRQDLAESLGWYSLDVFDFMGAMTVLLDTISHQKPELTDVIIDVPPGLFGFGQEMLALATALSGDGLPDGYIDWKTGPVEWDARAFLVTTPDANDVLPVYEYVAQHVTELLGARILLNKSTTVPPLPEKVIGPTLGALIDARRIEQIAFLPQTLGRIFQDGDLHTDKDKDLGQLTRTFVPEQMEPT